MSTNLRDIGGSTLTPEEAEAVFELWARRQADTETLRSRLSVQDMAEAMSISPAEVEEMLSAVRAHRAAPAPTTQMAPLTKVKPVNTFLIAMAVVAWFAVLAIAGYAATKADNREHLVPAAPFESLPPASVVDAVTEAAPPAFTSDLRQMAGTFSDSLTVEFDGASLRGDAIAAHRLLPIETLQAVVDSISPAPSAQTASNLSDAEILQVFQSNGNSKLGTDVIAFKEIVLRAGSNKVSEQIPVALTQEDRLYRLVREEQARRLRILANKAERNLDF